MIPLVMCIDDDPIVLMLNELILRDQRFCNKLIKIDKAESALAYFEEQATKPMEEQAVPTLIFLDINMPVMDGWEFLDIFTTKFSSFHDRVKVVILSSSVNPADLELANNHPLALSFMPKPVGEIELGIIKKHPSLAHFFE